MHASISAKMYLWYIDLDKCTSHFRLNHFAAYADTISQHSTALSGDKMNIESNDATPVFPDLDILNALLIRCEKLQLRSDHLNSRLNRLTYITNDLIMRSDTTCARLADFICALDAIGKI